MYTREQAKSITDKVIDMAKGTAGVEVTLTGGERSGTRWANSTITTNLVQYDRQVNVTVRVGQKVGTAETRDFTDAGLKAMVDEAVDTFGRDPRVALRRFDEVRDAGAWTTADVPGSPFAVALDADGTVLAKGTFNTGAQLESVLAAAERRRGAVRA